MASNCNADDYCVIALDRGKEDHGVVVGNIAAPYKLVVLNTSDMHFDACLPL